MEVKIYDRDSEPLPRRPRAVALGLFDGLHLGHRAVISLAAGRELNGREEPLTVSAYTFRQPPGVLKDGACALCSDRQELLALGTLGVEELIRADFEAVKDLTPESFVEQVLCRELDARLVCCGFNYRFGKDGAGDAALLRELCASKGIAVAVAGAVEVDGETVSSSRIRRLIEQGEMEQASRLLGRPFVLDFPVSEGQKLGRRLGTPTINQRLPDRFVRPCFGVYASSVEVDGQTYYGVTNVGMRPTVAGGGDAAAAAPISETWIPDYSGDLYGREVPVTLVSFLRPEQRFSSVEELKQRIWRDGETVRERMCGGQRNETRAVLFDFDDTLQDRAAAFQKYIAFFLDKYFPELPPEEKQRRGEEMLHRNCRGYVDYPEFFRSLMKEWGWTHAPAAEALHRELQFRFPEYTTLFPDAVEVLTVLRQRGYRVGVITNGLSVQQNRKLDAAGIRPLLDIAVVSGDEQIHKPEPEIFRRTASRLGVPCPCCIFVGDHLVNDVQGAASAGMQPVFMNAVGVDTCPPGVREIRRLDELLEWL